MDQNFGDLQFNQNHRKDMQVGEVARGQKIVIFAVLLNILALGAMYASLANHLSGNVGVMVYIGSWAVRLLAYVLGIYGVVKIGSGLEWSGFSKFLLVFVLLLPLINVLTLLIVNGHATAHLKAAGYKVGLAGAYK